MSAHAKPAPVAARFWTPGVLVMVGFMLTAFLFVIARYIGGLAAVTNLDNAHPWGLWIGIDVATGVALAAGGFTTAALAHIFGRHQYEAVTRPALLTAMLGYTFVSLGLIVDLGRSWAIWHPAVYWQGNSVLFEVAMCVMIYLHVLYIEFIPIVVEHFKGKVRLPGRLSNLDNVVEALLGFTDRILSKVMWIFIIAGAVLSCMHQSGLGSLMLIAPTKLHPLWYTPILPLLFLTSAIAVGYPMVVFETTLTTSSLGLDGEMEILTPLTRITIFLLGIYLGLKIGDMVVRGTYVYLLDGTVQSKAFLVEMLVGVIIPWFMLLTPKLRRSRRAIFIACTLIIGGVALNRINVFLVGFQPPYAETSYFPAIGEVAITAGLISALMFIYRISVTYLPVLSVRDQEAPS
ncbi:MAG: Ni/Fe-hydrogenase cytochrome b subunit [Desulfobacteraceae bacterium]|nr:Ni/Fe-hydrogenase cytochrome b subunit [Desulfobacteraceae bacterium]